MSGSWGRGFKWKELLGGWHLSPKWRKQAKWLGVGGGVGESDPRKVTTHAGVYSETDQHSF